MSLKIVDELTFTHTVWVMTPSDGGATKESLKATFRVLDVDEARSFDLSDGAGVTDFLERIVVRLDDIVGADNRPIPYSDGVRKKLVKLPHVRAALAQAYFEAVGGARAGN